MRGYGQFCPVALGAEVFAGPRDVNLTRDETAAVTETVVTFLLSM